MKGYRENEVATRNAFRNGWFLTGDLGRLDEEGFLYVTGRIKEMINRGGEKVLPAEIDEVLMAHPAVKKASAFGRPHPTLQEDVAAAVVLHAGAEVSERELRSYSAGQLALYKVPRRIFFVDSIPVGPTGKVRRGDLASQVMASVDPPVAARTELESRIADIWRRLLNVERVGVRDNFFELGGDSLAVTLMMAELETELGASAEALDQTKFFESPEISTLANLLGGESAVPVRPQRGERPPFVVLQRQGGRIPFFCVPGADENPYYFRELAQELGEDQPFYIVRDPRPMAYRPRYTVEEVAARFIEQLSTIQRTGPYLIGGHCFGGIVAYEMARQLVARSETIGRVVMFETPAPGYPKVLRHWKRYGQQAMAALRGERQIRISDLREHLRLLMKLWRMRAVAMPESAAQMSEHWDNLNKRAFFAYQLKPLACNVTQFIAVEEQRCATILDDPLVAWRDFVRGEFEVRMTAGKADRIFRQPHVRMLAGQMRAVLEPLALATQATRCG